MAGLRTRQTIFPLALFLVGVVSLPLLLLWQLRELPPSLRTFGFLFGVVYIAWVFIERRVTFGTARETTSGSDRGTLQFYGVARLVTVFAALLVPPTWSGTRSYMLLTFVIFVAGVALRLTAIRHLGRFYSHQVRTLETHQVIQAGPYRSIRHPAYAGMLIAHLGFIAYFCNPVSVAAFLGLLVPAVVLRIVVEEQALLRAVAGYEAYSRSRKRLIPRVW